MKHRIHIEITSPGSGDAAQEISLVGESTTPTEKMLSILKKFAAGYGFLADEPEGNAGDNPGERSPPPIDFAPAIHALQDDIEELGEDRDEIRKRLSELEAR